MSDPRCTLEEYQLLHSPEMEVAAVQRYTDDPFLYFSSDKRRMEHLLGKELPSMPSEEPTRRKKRISFELDPSYALVTRFPELLLNDMDQEEAKEGEEKDNES